MLTNTEKSIILDTIYQLGKLVNVSLEESDVRELLGLTPLEEQGVEEVLAVEEREEVSHQQYLITGRLLKDSEKVELPPVHSGELDVSLLVKKCYLSGDYMFDEAGRVYDVAEGGYLITERMDGTDEEYYQLVINRMIINVPLSYVKGYVKGNEDEHVGLLKDAIKVIEHDTKVVWAKEEEASRLAYTKRIKERESNRYREHMETSGLKLLHTPYTLTSEGRVYDAELGRLLSINNKGYTKVYKGLKTEVNVSMEHVKNVLEHGDFKVFLKKEVYTGEQCDKMWYQYQQSMLTPVEG